MGARRRGPGGHGAGRGGQGAPRLEADPSRRCKPTATPRLCPPPSGGRGASWSQSRACCPWEERPRRFMAVALSMDPELELLFIFDFHSRGAAISRQLKNAGKGRREAAFSAVRSPGRTCLRALGSSGAWEALGLRLEQALTCGNEGNLKLSTASSKCPRPERAGIYLGCETRGSSFTSWVRISGWTPAGAPRPRSAPGGFTSRLVRLSAHFVHLKEAHGKRTAC